MKISFIEFKPIDKDIYYIFYIEYRGFEWHIRKRFSNFHSLYLELVKKYERVPKIEKTLLSVDYTKRLDDIVAFINYIVYNFSRFKSENYIMNFFYSDIFVNSVDDFISINKNKQREYVKNFLMEPKISNYKKQVYKKFKPSLYQAPTDNSVQFEDQRFKEYNALTSQGGKVIG